MDPKISDFSCNPQYGSDQESYPERRTWREMETDNLESGMCYACQCNPCQCSGADYEPYIEAAYREA